MASVDCVQFIAGKRAVLDAMVDTVASAREHAGIEQFRLGHRTAARLSDALHPDATASLVTSATPEARHDVAPLLEQLGERVAVGWYGTRDADGQVFSHVKTATADGMRATFGTAAMRVDRTPRIDWGLNATGAMARAAADVQAATTAGKAAEVRTAMETAARHEVFYNDAALGTLHATEAWFDAVGAVGPGDDVLVAPKKFTSKRAARALAAAAGRGAHVEAVTGRSKPGAREILQAGGVPLLHNRWPGASLHGNLTVAGTRLLLGSMYLSKGSMGLHATRQTRELLVATEDAAAAREARRAIADIPTQVEPA